jgi:hypothetical protein
MRGGKDTGNCATIPVTVSSALLMLSARFPAYTGAPDTRDANGIASRKGVKVKHYSHSRCLHNHSLDRRSVRWRCEGAGCRAGPDRGCDSSTVHGSVLRLAAGGESCVEEGVQCAGACSYRRSLRRRECWPSGARSGGSRSATR